MYVCMYVHMVEREWRWRTWKKWRKMEEEEEEEEEEVEEEEEDGRSHVSLPNKPSNQPINQSINQLAIRKNQWTYINVVSTW